MTLLDTLHSLNAYRLYLDANCFIYAAEEHGIFAEIIKPVFAAIEQQKFVTVSSELSLSECLVKPIADQDDELQAFYETTLQSSPLLSIVPVSRHILREAASLRAAFKTLRLPDAIHAATALNSTCDAFITNDARLKTVTALSVLTIKDFTEP